MKGIFFLILAPLMILNMLGGIIGGIWLAFLGEWSTLIFGIAYMVVGALAISVLLLPAMALAIPVAALGERSIIAALLLGIPSLIWTFAVMAVSCAWVFGGITATPEGTLIPYFLWGYATAIAPWSYMASKERDNSYSAASVFFAQVGIIAMMVAVWVNPYDTTIWRLLYWMAPVMIVGMVLQLVMVAAIAFEERRWHGLQ
jgi:hypothetical protein